jgi:hypothetical protein
VGSHAVVFTADRALLSRLQHYTAFWGDSKPSVEQEGWGIPQVPTSLDCDEPMTGRSVPLHSPTLSQVDDACGCRCLHTRQTQPHPHTQSAPLQGEAGDAPGVELLSDAVSRQRSGNSIPVIPLCASRSSAPQLQALASLEVDGLAFPPALLGEVVAGMGAGMASSSSVGDMVAALKSSLGTKEAQLTQARAEARSIPRLHSQAFEELVAVEKVCSD